MHSVVIPVQKKGGREITEAGIQMVLHQPKLISFLNFFFFLQENPMGSNIPVGFYGKVILKHTDFLIMNSVLLHIFELHISDPF